MASNNLKFGISEDQLEMDYIFEKIERDQYDKELGREDKPKKEVKKESSQFIQFSPQVFRQMKEEDNGKP